MKKYIKPVQQIYNVSTCGFIAQSVGIAGGDGNYKEEHGIDVKEEKGSGIWDLYN